MNTIISTLRKWDCVCLSAQVGSALVCVVRGWRSHSLHTAGSSQVERRGTLIDVCVTAHPAHTLVEHLLYLCILCHYIVVFLFYLLCETPYTTHAQNIKINSDSDIQPLKTLLIDLSVLRNAVNRWLSIHFLSMVAQRCRRYYSHLMATRFWVPTFPSKIQCHENQHHKATRWRWLNNNIWNNIGMTENNWQNRE